MKDVMGLIVTGENDINLGELTSQRAVAALPIAGRYRVIDFQLSSMVHTGIKNVGIITQKNYSSLMDHVGSGREWDLHGKQGMVILPPFLTRENMGVYSGLLDALKSNTNFLSRSKQEYVVLTNSHTVYNIDFSDALRAHVEKKADITVLYSRNKASGVDDDDTYFTVDENNKVTGMDIGALAPKGDAASRFTSPSVNCSVSWPSRVPPMVCMTLSATFSSGTSTKAHWLSMAMSMTALHGRLTPSSRTSTLTWPCWTVNSVTTCSRPSARSTPRSVTICRPATRVKPSVTTP